MKSYNSTDPLDSSIQCKLYEIYNRRSLKKDVPGGKREWEIRERPQNITIQKYGLSQGRISVSLMQHSLL